MTNEIQQESQPPQSWKTKMLITGAVLGALTGLGTAYLMVQRAEESELEISTSEGIKLGVSIFTFLRQVSKLGD
jgi:glucokinase